MYSDQVAPVDRGRYRRAGHRPRRIGTDDAFAGTVGSSVDIYLTGPLGYVEGCCYFVRHALNEKLRNRLRQRVCSREVRITLDWHQDVQSVSSGCLHVRNQVGGIEVLL